MKIVCVILAAGLGKRMNSAVPKVLHRICGVPMLQSVINTARKLKPEKIVVVAGKHIDMLKKTVAADDVLFVRQKKAKGTAHALASARQALKNFRNVIIVMNGDSPLVTDDTIRRFLKLHLRGRNSVSVISFTAVDPSSYGRIVRSDSGKVLSIVEEKDADRMQKNIHEVNSGVYAINHDALCLLDDIKMNSAKGEYYLTDIVALSSKKGLKTAAFCIGSDDEFMGVNTREELSRASQLMKKNIINKWIGKGVSFLDPQTVFVHYDVHIGRDTTIYPNVFLEGNTKIGRGTTIYPNVRVKDGFIGSNVVIKDSSVIEGSTIKDRASIGPFAHIRPGSEIGNEARIGNFVELKKAVIGRMSKASHLSYLGDAKIGERVNIGAGTITCNYDGERKHSTIIDNGVFVGSDSQLIAPLRIGKGAYIGAGSTITKDVPPSALALSRVVQKNIMDWAKKRSGMKNKMSKSRNKK
ncbi:MAG: bifunctional UDP-N-acetylglucosamine diphosphorylase/glucosamine-1-phosphate N-acetyltransferase GlmU [Nitrospirota bacterium]